MFQIKIARVTCLFAGCFLIVALGLSTDGWTQTISGSGGKRPNKQAGGPSKQKGSTSSKGKGKVRTSNGSKNGTNKSPGKGLSVTYKKSKSGSPSRSGSPSKQGAPSSRRGSGSGASRSNSQGSTSKSGSGKITPRPGETAASFITRSRAQTADRRTTNPNAKSSTATSSEHHRAPSINGAGTSSNTSPGRDKRRDAGRWDSSKGKRNAGNWG